MREAKVREGSLKSGLALKTGAHARVFWFYVQVLRIATCDLAFGATLFDFNYGLYVDDICMNIHYVRSTLPQSQLQGQPQLNRLRGGPMEGERAALPAWLPANGETDCRRSLSLTVCVFINPFGRADGVLIGVEPIGQQKQSSQHACVLHFPPIHRVIFYAILPYNQFVCIGMVFPLLFCVTVRQLFILFFTDCRINSI